MTSPVPSKPALWTLSKAKRSIERRGWAGSLAYVLSRLSVQVKTKPRRQFAAWMEKIYDRRHHVDTAGRFPTDTLYAGASRYQASPQKGFERAIGSLGVDCQRFTFCDYGCGKGKALLFAAAHPFRAVVGVEIVESLTETARQNLKTYTGKVACRNVTIVCADVTQFETPPGALVCYFYNPFDERIMREVVERIHRSFLESPREIYLVYFNPVLSGLVEEMPECRRLSAGASYATYVLQDRTGGAGA